MYRREFLILAALAMMAVGMVAGCTGLLVYRLNVAVSEVAEITVPDFLNTGQLIQRLLENWSKVLLIQRTIQPEERLRLIDEIKANSTESVRRLTASALSRDSFLMTNLSTTSSILCLTYLSNLIFSSN